MRLLKPRGVFQQHLLMLVSLFELLVLCVSRKKG